MAVKKKLEAKLAADPTLDIDVNRALQTSDLAVSDLTAEIAIELPKVWTERFQQKATFKRVTKAIADATEDSGNTDGTDGTDSSGSQNQGTNTGDNTNTGENTGGGSNSGSGDDDEHPGAGG